MKLIILTRDFYNDYIHCKEILKKNNCPYACFEIRTETAVFAIPFRHNIKHRNAFFTIGNAELDFTKTVVITDEKYISSDIPTIENAEFTIIKREEQKIKFLFSKYLNQYRRAMKHRNNNRSRMLLKYSSLQYFEEYL